MKNLYVAGLLVVCSLYSCTTLAQPPVKQLLPNKPLQFSTLPDKFEVNLPAFDRLATTRTEEKISFQFGKFVFTGTITEHVVRSAQCTSINIQSTNMPGTLFNLNILTQPGNTQLINGTIINPKSGDVLVLVHENDRYYLQKLPQQLFMTE